MCRRVTCVNFRYNRTATVWNVYLGSDDTTRATDLQAHHSDSSWQCVCTGIQTWRLSETCGIYTWKPRTHVSHHTTWLQPQRKMTPQELNVTDCNQNLLLGGDTLLWKNGVTFRTLLWQDGVLLRSHRAPRYSRKMRAISEQWKTDLWHGGMTLRSHNVGSGVPIRIHWNFHFQCEERADNQRSLLIESRRCAVGSLILTLYRNDIATSAYVPQGQITM
jgi:hypothetical protein